MKTKRQLKIVEFVKNKSVETQEDLLNMLRAEGFVVTQATISRDIKELRLVKTLGTDGKYRYSVAAQENQDVPSRFLSIFNEAVISIENAMNIVCLHCHTGMAQAVCASMDSMHFQSVVGTIAGDDTIFVLCRDIDNAEALVAELNRLFGR